MAEEDCPGQGLFGRATEIAVRALNVERYSFVERVLMRFGYARHGRAAKGVLVRYLERMTGLSRQQVTRLVRRYRQEDTLSTRHGSPARLSRRFTATDVALLADMEALHGTVSGPTTKTVMKRDDRLFGDARFERLAGISVSYLYNSLQPAGRDPIPAHATALEQNAVHRRLFSDN
jgi:hypothetical protein